MGNCFSHGKGRPPPHNQTTLANPTVTTTYKGKGEITWETTVAPSNIVASNGNTEPVAVREARDRERAPPKATVFAHAPANRSVRASHSEPIKASRASADTKVTALFESYAEPADDVILADGIERLCADLCLSPDEFRVLVLAWQLNAAQMCRFTRTEFVEGCRQMRVDTLKAIQCKLPELVTDLEHDSEKFKDLYRFTFRFGLDSSLGQRILPADMAVLLWRLVFSIREPPILSRWLQFLECHPHVRGIPRDTWNMFLNFAESVGHDLSTYDDAEAWPSIFDDFVEFENDQANQNVTAKEKDNNIIKLDMQ